MRMGARAKGEVTANVKINRVTAWGSCGEILEVRGRYKADLDASFEKHSLPPSSGGTYIHDGKPRCRHAPKIAEVASVCIEVLKQEIISTRA